MKKVILEETVVPVILINNVDTNKFYGVQVTETERGFITCRHYEDQYVVRNPAVQLTVGNAWTFAEGQGLIEIIRKCIQKGYPVFEFDSAKALFSWLL